MVLARTLVLLHVEEQDHYLLCFERVRKRVTALPISVIS